MVNTSRGFITIATGNDKYYDIAWNLLLSYRFFSDSPLPFAILCDRQTSKTKDFDVEIINTDVTCSYMDKLMLSDICPFDETIFIDADCLAYADLNVLFDIFSSADDVSCFGNTFPLTMDTQGWYSLKSFPEQKSADVIDRDKAQLEIPYSVGLHGGVYFVRKSKISNKCFSNARQIAKNYRHYDFLLFKEPADEPCIALAMAINGLKPVSWKKGVLKCYWESPPPVLKMRKRMASLTDGTHVYLVHFGSGNTQTPIYRQEIAWLNCLNKGKRMPITTHLFYIIAVNAYKFKCILRKNKQKIMTHLSKNYVLKELWHLIKQ